MLQTVGMNEEWCLLVVPSSPIFVTLMKEALRSSETWILTRATRRNIPEDAIHHCYRREGSQALPVCPSGKCKYFTGNVEV
jgi:hypothetical protein